MYQITSYMLNNKELDRVGYAIASDMAARYKRKLTEPNTLQQVIYLDTLSADYSFLQRIGRLGFLAQFLDQPDIDQIQEFMTYASNNNYG